MARQGPVDELAAVPTAPAVLKCRARPLPEPAMPRFALALCAALSLATAALAEAPVPPDLARYIASPEHQKMVLAAAQWINQRLPDGCAAPAFRVAAPVIVLRPARFDATGRPIAGIWHEWVEAAGCGRARRLNVMTIAAPNKAPSVLPTLPGTTRADPLLQRDGLRYALIGAAPLAAKDCKKVAITDTRFDAFEGTPAPDARPGFDPRPWRETWTVWACGKAIDVPIHFAPDATGTGIHVQPSEAALQR